MNAEDMKKGTTQFALYKEACELTAIIAASRISARQNKLAIGNRKL